MNWLAWDGSMHISINPYMFKHIFKKPITTWKNRINYKERYKELKEIYPWVN